MPDFHFVDSEEDIEGIENFSLHQTILHTSWYH